MNYQLKKWKIFSDLLIIIFTDELPAEPQEEDHLPAVENKDEDDHLPAVEDEDEDDHLPAVEDDQQQEEAIDNDDSK
jgi:hypothetical protein